MKIAVKNKEMVNFKAFRKPICNGHLNRYITLADNIKLEAYR